MNSSEIDLSIIIVNYNTKILLDLCLTSIFASNFNSYSYEIIISDNGSTDGSLEMVKEKYNIVIRLDNKFNLGFAKANNAAIRIANGKYILLLNSDTEVHQDTFQIMLDFMNDHPKAGAATCLLKLQNGKIDPACHRGLPTPWASFSYYLKFELLFPKMKFFSGYHQWYKNLQSIHEIDCPSGAFFLIRKSVIDRIGYLDEDYFMYAEDIDLAYRIKKAGYQIWFNPTVSILHKKKQSGLKNNNQILQKKIKYEFYKNNKLFYSKNFASIYHPLVTNLIYSIFNIRLYLISKFGI